MAAPVLRPLSAGEVLDVSFNLYRTLFWPLVAIAAVCRVVPLALSVFIRPEMNSADPMAPIAFVADHWPILLGNMFLDIVAGAFAVAATTLVVSAAYLGGALAPSEALRRASRSVGRLIGVSIVFTISITVGFIVLIIPGVMLFAGLVLGSVVVVLEPGLGPIAALDRSWALTSGLRWKVLGSVLVATLLLIIPSITVGILSAFGTAIGTWSETLSVIVSGVLSIFVLPLLYVVLTVLYYDARIRKEGFDLELLASSTQHAA